MADRPSNNSEEQPNNNNNNSSSSSSSSNDDDDGGITEGRLVQVASRTWPGINKPGGVARVTMVVHSNNNNNNGGGGGLLRSHVDVQYIVGNGKEKRVPIEYVQLAPQYETSRDDCSRRTNAAASLRDRSMLLGRCRQCGSLRTDCGSCDWATEEQQVVVLSTTAAAAAAASTKPPRTKHKPSRARKSVASKDDDDDDVSLSSSSSSSSSDEEDVLLQELVEKNQRQYRKYLKSKQKWNRYYHRHDTKTSEPKQPTSDNDDDDDDDDDMSELLEQRDQRYKRYLQMKSKWKQLPSSMSLDDKSGQEKMQRRRRRRHRHRYQHQPSVLEVATHRQAPTKLNTQTLRVGNQDDRNDNSRQDLNVTTTTTTTPKKRKPTTTSREQGSDTRMDDNDNDNDNGYLQVSPVGVAESSSPESFSQQHNSYYNDNDNGDGDDHWPPEQSYFLDSAGLDDDTDGDNVGMRLLPEEEEESNNNTLALSQFIQPEGRDAAENLPEDTLDRTQNLPYHRLPQFFDTMATQLEDTKLPDFKLRVADLQRQWRQILDVTQRRKRRTSLFSSNEEQQQEDTPSSRISSKSLLEECIQTWHQVRIKLIRNGTDQARAALRRLLDDRLYRRHRKTMTPQQRKQCRGSALEDARNLRMDALENAVEGLVRKLKEICQDCEQQQQQQVADEAADGDDSVSAASFQEEPYQTQDLVPLEDSTVDGSLTHGEEQGLAPFHPHMHASRKKTTTTIKAVHQQKRARHKGTSVNTNKKRLKSSSRSHQTVVEVGSENPQQSDVSQPPNQQHPNNDTSTMDVTTDRESFESSGIPILGHSQEDEDDDEVPTFNLFDTEAAEGGPPSRMNDRNLVRANGLPNLNRRRRAGATASNLSEEPQPSHYRSRSNAVPISQRMQAFLDANSGNGLDYLINDAEGEGGNENNQKQRRVRELQQRRQRSRVQSNSSDRSRITGVRSGRNVRSERGNRRSAQERNGANNGSIGDESQDRLINDDLDHNLPVSPEGEPIDALSLFSQLEANMPASGEPRNETVLLAGHNKPDISVLCAELDRSYPNSSQSCFAALKNLHYLLGLDETADAKATFLQNALALLQNHGTVTLQELISTKSSQLSVHVRLLSECLYALHIEPNNNLLDPHHGPVSEILLANNRRNFVDFLVLQLVDSIYSLLHPSAWALDIGNHQTQILQILNPLRDALARLIPLTESVCRCVVERFGCQEWRQGVINRGHAFVSSVAPGDWKTYLETGKYPERPPEGKPFVSYNEGTRQSLSIRRLNVVHFS